MRSFRCCLTLFCATALIGWPLSASAASPAATASPVATPGASVTVQPGDSWPTVRNRMFSLEALKKANPKLDAEMLHPGEVVRAPYVPVAELEREAAARQAAEARLGETKARLAETERDRASLEARRHAVVQGERRIAWMQTAVVVLILVALALIALLALVMKTTRAARQQAADIAARHHALQSQYDGLRKSLHDIDVSLQRRVVSLLHLHGGKVVSEGELKASMGQVLDFTQELKKKHETTA